MKVKEIIEATQGTLVSGELKQDIKSFSTNSRDIKKGDFFIPLVGERFDGHNYLEDAFEKGAIGAIVDRPVGNNNYCSQRDTPIIQVDNTLFALQNIAAYYRNKFNIPFIGITGSSGKTTTKDMLASILSKQFPTLKNEGNYNNEIGVPLTLLKLEKKQKAAVIEMGMQGIGEIEVLADIVRPKIAIITNIGEAHLLQLRNKRNTAIAKGEILKYADYAVLPKDDEFFIFLKKLAPNNCKIIEYSMRDEKKYQKFLKHLTLPGGHNILNALAAIKTAEILKVKPKAIIEGLKDFRPSGKRMNISIKNGVAFINDSYNANPSSMKAALSVLKDYKGKRKIAVLGDMLELGPESGNYHQEIIAYANKLKIDKLITVGKNFSALPSYAKASAGTKEAITHLNETLKPGDVVLIKGSRGMKMEEIAEAF